MSRTQLIKGIPKLAKKGWKKLTADKDVIRLKEINEKLKKTPHRAKILQTDNQPSQIKQDVFEDHIDEVKAIYDRYNKGKK